MTLCFQCFCCQSPKRVFNTVRPFVFSSTWLTCLLGRPISIAVFDANELIEEGTDSEILLSISDTCFDGNMSLSDDGWQLCLAELFAQILGLLNMNMTNNMNKGIFGNLFLSNVWIIVLWCWRNGSSQNWFSTSRISNFGFKLSHKFGLPDSQCKHGGRSWPFNRRPVRMYPAQRFYEGLWVMKHGSPSI